MTIDNLYVVKRTIINPNNPPNRTVNITLPATFDTPAAAKQEAKAVLSKEGYTPAYFTSYAVNDHSTDWRHGDTVVVYARGPSEQIFLVEVEPVPDYIGLQADSTGCVKAPLYHVLQTVVDRCEDGAGLYQSSVIRGTHTRCELAHKQALGMLMQKGVSRQDLTKYEECEDEDTWPFGIEVLVHALDKENRDVFVSVISDHEMSEMSELRGSMPCL